VEFGGSFRVLDWQVAEAEDRGPYQALFQRLYERGLEEVPLIVADGCGSVRLAAEIELANHRCDRRCFEEP
jgi:transposase-like protein